MLAGDVKRDGRRTARNLQLARKILLQEGNVFGEELLLERLRRRGDHHALPAADRRHQVRQRLARARPRLDNGVLLPPERFLHQLRLTRGSHPPLAHIDEDFQIAKWGEDAEAKARRAHRWREMQAASRLIELLSTAQE